MVVGQYRILGWCFFLRGLHAPNTRHRKGALFFYRDAPLYPYCDQSLVAMVFLMPVETSAIAVSLSRLASSQGFWLLVGAFLWLCWIHGPGAEHPLEGVLEGHWMK